MEKTPKDNLDELKINLKPGQGVNSETNSNSDSYKNNMNIVKQNQADQESQNLENEINTHTNEISRDNTYRYNIEIDHNNSNYNTPTYQSTSTVKSEKENTNGIDFERVVGYTHHLKDVFTRITCSICTLIPFDPLECKNCNAIVCRQCKEKWDKKECLFRCGGEGDDNPSRILRDIINSFTIKCKNIGKGCGEQFKLERIKLHEVECDYEEIKCRFTDCKYMGIRKNVVCHIDKCEYNKIKCKFCKKIFRKSEFDKHIEDDCEEVLMECNKCQKSEKRKNFLDSSHNCITMLKEEIKELHRNLNLQMESYQSLKIYNEELTGRMEEEKRINFEKNYLTTIYISMLRSSLNIVFEDITSKIKPYSIYNPLHIPYIFRFMTSSRTVQITNLAENTFFKINLNINFEIPTSHQSIVTSNKRIFIVGGVSHEKKTYEFDIINKSLKEKADMNIGRRRHILTELRTGVFIATGGSNSSEDVLRECEAYLTANDKWIKISPMNLPRFYHTAFAFDDVYLYAVAGCHTGTSSLINMNSIERIELDYDFNGSWELLTVKESDLFKPRSRLSYIFIEKNKILLFGGVPDHQPVFLDIQNLEMFNACQYNIEGRFFFNDRCTWQNETLFISSQSSRCIFNHLTNTWITREFIEEMTL